MKNKWSLYQRSEIWKYSFPSKNLKSYIVLVEKFVTSCIKAGISKLNKKNDIEGEKDLLHLVQDYLDHLEGLRKSRSY